MVSAAIARNSARLFVRQIGDDHHLVLHVLEGRQCAGKLEASAFLHRSPVHHHRAVGDVAEPQADLGIGRGFQQRRLRRHHGIE